MQANTEAIASHLEPSISIVALGHECRKAAGKAVRSELSYFARYSKQENHPQPESIARDAKIQCHMHKWNANCEQTTTFPQVVALS